MTKRMLSFLKHINIENIDDFDIDFEMVSRNRFKRDQIDMVIVKKTPWKYHLLRQFQDGLNRIDYPYLLRFSYVTRPDIDDLLNILDDWYQTLYRLPHNLEIDATNDDFIKVLYSDETEEEQYVPIISDFRDFLDFLNYEFSIVEEVKPKEEAINIPKSEIRKILRKATLEAEQTIEEESTTRPVHDRSEVEQLIESEKMQLNEETEEAMLKIAKQNARAMRRERERVRLNKRGNYQPFETIDDIGRDSDNVDFSAKVFSIEVNEYGDRKRLVIGLFDEAGGAIYANTYQNATINDELVIEMKKWGTNVRVRGAAFFDDYNKSMAVRAHFIDLLPPDIIPEDKAEKKRVELHLHSNMSAMDGINHMIEYAKHAKTLGHHAMAITDHAVVQSYPAAQEAAEKTGIKMLYGVEFYMIDDVFRCIKNPADIILNKAKYVVLDLETTGLNCFYDRIIEFGAVRVENGIVVESLDILINPERKLPKKIIEITNITDEMLVDKPIIEEVWPKILAFIDDAIIVTHNADFDFSFIQHSLTRYGRPKLNNPVIDTLALSRYLFPQSRNHRLGSLCRNMEVTYNEDSAHRADYDARILNEVWQPMLVMLTKDDHHLTHADLGKLETPNTLRKYLRPTHTIALAKNKAGLKALYRLVSYSHVDYFADVAKIPRREIEKLRKDLILGSACLNGEVFKTATYYGDDALKEAMAFYDYIEIQPLENYSFLVNMGEMSQEELLVHVKDIVRVADELGIPICATGDVHYVTKKHKIFRDVYMNAKGIGGVPHPLNPYSRNRVPPFENPDQHYRSTDEMLECMAFLGPEKAYEVTVTNTNAIADMIEELVPVPQNHLYTPKIENSEQILKDLCFSKAHELYGNPLPEIIQTRLDKELNGIISNGYSVIYYIAHMIVKKAREDGYIVGSRGSVGSSLAATMANITEVNPLAPHYRCPACKYLEWTSESMPQYRSGYD
ncbi:MAG: PHP domain-containing protein, partial [Erysipelotrichia bacterium]|nr:PHP domain-containing protein [Erysipelotrichia bacterium]